MARKSNRYANSSWGREAQWEDTENRVEYEFPARRDAEYGRTLRAAKELLDQGKTQEEIRVALALLRTV